MAPREMSAPPGPTLTAGAVKASATAQVSMIQQAQGWGWGGTFSPGDPPVPPTQEPVRVFDFATGYNRQQTPRMGEPFGFPQLRSFANVELVRLAIETRKDQMERLGWNVKVKGMGAKQSPEASQLERIKAAEAFFRRPDGETDFGAWLRESLEDLLVLDAPAFELRRTRSGRLIGLDIVPGDTIKLLVDETGRPPRAPQPRFQQMIKGRVWNSLTAQDLLYAPRNKRPNHVYGFGPVEQIIVTINILINRQARQLSWFTEGNMPPGILNGPEGWSADQMKGYQEWFDNRMNDPASRAKLQWAPYGSKFQPFKDPPLKDEFDEWLARVVAFAFSLPPTPFIRQMNRSTADNDGERSLEEGREPLMLWWKRIADRIIQDEHGFDDLEWVWEPPSDLDAKAAAEINDLNVRNGSATLDEVRAARGEDPLPNGLGKVHRIYTGTGAVPLEIADRPPEENAALIAKATPDPATGKPGAGGAPSKPAKATTK